MKGVVFVGDRQIDIREVPKPTPGPGEVVLAMKASGLCGSDLRPYRLPRAQRGNPSALTVGGHEPCGIVAEVGPEVTTVRVGDRIMMHHYTGCAGCAVSATRRCVYPIMRSTASLRGAAIKTF
jgi:threonine dehydrogenase-like Zn-dependent dehydrogenase